MARTGRRTAIAAAASMLALPSGAAAAVTVSADATTISVVGTNAADTTALFDTGPDVVITNAIAAGLCVQDGADAVCPRGARSFAVTLNDGNDSLALQSSAAGTFNGGPADDVFTSAPPAPLINTWNGGDGSDTFNIGASVGSDIVDGGAGTDLVDYLERGAAQLGGSVAVDVDGLADDGGPAEGDNIGASVETLRGTRQGGDTLIAPLVDGDLGGDVLVAPAISYEIGTPYPRPAGAARTAGVDVDLLTLDNGDGDTLQGAPQSVTGTSFGERLSGNGAANTIGAGGGADAVDGRGGADSLLGGDGDDAITANDGVADQVDCGAGQDTGSFDAIDVLTGCEPASDTVAPVLSRVTVSPAAFYTRKGRRRRAAGTSFRFSLSEPATVQFTIERKSRGRRVKGRCRPRTRRNRRRPRCTRFKRVGGFERAAGLGSNAVRFSGKLRGRRLRVGSYRLTLRATDLAGNRSAPARATFRVVP